MWSIEELASRGIFRRARRADRWLDAIEQELLRSAGSEPTYEAFMRLAVRSRKNILVSGPTGSGKTTWTKALIREIPSDERLMTIEDAKELVLDRHPNHVRLFYSKDDQGVARVTPKQLLESCLRMKPDRILLAELRAEEAFDYLAQRQFRPSGLDHQHARHERRTGLRATGAAGEAESGRPRAGARRHQEPPVSADRRRDPVRRRASRAIHQGNLVSSRSASTEDDGRLWLHGWSGLALAYAAVQVPMIAGLIRARANFSKYAWLPLAALPLTAIGRQAVSAHCSPRTAWLMQFARGGCQHCCLGMRAAAPLLDVRQQQGFISAAAQIVESPRRAKARSRPDASEITLWPGSCVPAQDETKHFKLIGTTGTGKSTAIQEILRRALARGDRAVIADPDGGYMRRFYEPARGDIVLNPFDARSVKWDLFAEIKSPYDVEQLARSLIPDHEGRTEAGEAMRARSSRRSRGRRMRAA